MSGTVSSPQTYQLLNLLAPAGGSTHGVKVTVSLANNSARINWPGLMQNVGVWLPQGCMVDNTNGSADVVMQEIQWGWSRRIRAGQSQTFNFPAVSTPEFGWTSTGTINPVVSFFDFPQFPDTYINESNFGGSDVTIVAPLPLPVTFDPGTVEPQPYPVTALAGPASATPGASVQVLAITAGSVTGGGFINNPAAASLFVNPTGLACTVTAGGAILELTQGQSFIIPPGLVNGITVNAVAAQAFTAVVW